MKTWRPLAFAAGLSLLGAACGGVGAGTQAPADLSGSIEIDGSSTVEPLSLAIAEEYRAQAPNVTVNVGRAGTGGGFERFCAGETDISDASRAIEEDEIAACEANGVEYIELRVGTDALTVITHPDTDWTDCLTFEQMTTIFGADGAANWNEVDPAYPDQPLTIFAPDTDSGTYDFFIETVLADGESRQDYSASSDDNQIITGIAGTPGSWGFLGFAFYQENQETVKALEVDGGEGCVAPSVESAQDGSYPLTRPLFIYVKTEALARPEVADFVGFYLDTVNAVIDDVGYIAETDEALAEARATYEAAVGA
ncbi:MAG: PstS family phosphate ABC transporter substrate-binding protein [Egibacteraceae bacterium]